MIRIYFFLNTNIRLEFNGKLGQEQIRQHLVTGATSSHREICASVHGVHFIPMTSFTRYDTGLIP